MLAEAIQRAPQIVPVKGSPGKVHTLHGLIHGRVFDGQIELQARTYQFTFVPASAAIIDRRLVLQGSFALSSPARADRVYVDHVSAKLIATQGGVGAPPSRRPARTGTTPATETSPGQKVEQDRGPETEIQPGLHAFDSPKFDESGRPIVESTGALGFVGVLYFRLSSIDGGAARLPFDLNGVQLGGRLAATDDQARELQLVYSDVVAALNGERPDEQAANELVAKLNRILGPG